MKKVLFFISVLFVSISFVNGQTNKYHKFPTSDAIWREYRYTHYDFSFDFVECDDYQITLSGDTIIGNYTFHNMKTTGRSLYQCNMDASLPSFGHPFREDTLQKKIFISNEFSQDTLLYDFNLSLGDTLPQTWNNSYYSYNKVTLVDSILIGNEYHKRFGISNANAINYVYLIEGIGSTYGFETYLEPNTVDKNYNLICFKQNGQTVYPNTSYSCTMVITNTDEKNVESKIIISPNPFTTSTQITLDKSYHNISLSVYDIQGKLMLQKQYADCNQIQLNRNGLNNGMYFLKLTMDERLVETGKIVIRE